MADGGCDLEHGLHQLGIDDRLELVPDDRGEHRVDVLDEIERLAVHQHVLLLDAERVWIALAERVLEDAAAAREAGALPRDRGWIDLLLVRRRESDYSGRSASASISTIQRGSSNAETTSIELAGRTSRKTSPCARPTSSQSAAARRNVRVRTTCSALAAASASAMTMISRQRRAWP